MNKVIKRLPGIFTSLALVIAVIGLAFVSGQDIQVSNEGEVRRLFNLDPLVDLADFNNNTGNVNSSIFAEIWITDEGNKDNVIDLLTSEFTNDLRWTNTTDMRTICGFSMTGITADAFLDYQGILMNSIRGWQPERDGTFTGFMYATSRPNTLAAYEIQLRLQNEPLVNDTIPNGITYLQRRIDITEGTINFTEQQNVTFFYDTSGILPTGAGAGVCLEVRYYD